jgi:hypothetical protein
VVPVPTTPKSAATSTSPVVEGVPPMPSSLLRKNSSSGWNGSRNAKVNKMNATTITSAL